MCVFVIPVSAGGHWPNLLNGGHGGYVLSTSGVLLGRVDGSVWYHLPIGCTLEGILSSSPLIVKGHLCSVLHSTRTGGAKGNLM